MLGGGLSTGRHVSSTTLNWLVRDKSECGWNSRRVMILVISDLNRGFKV